MARPPKFDDDVILDRAMRAFWVRGWSTTSIRDLEDALGLKAPSIYRRFGSKDGLTRAVIDHYVEQVVRYRVDRYLPGSGDPIANLRSFFESAVTQSKQAVPLVGCLLTTVSFEAPHLAPDVRRSLDHGLDEIDRAVRSELARAETDGLLAEGVTADAATATLILAWHGLMVLARAGRPPGELQAQAGRAIASIAAPDL